jgi:hypothetical protein
MVETATILPFVPFLLGIIAIFISGGNMLYMVVGDALVFLAGVAFLKALK